MHAATQIYNNINHFLEFSMHSLRTFTHKLYSQLYFISNVHSCEAICALNAMHSL